MEQDRCKGSEDGKHDLHLKYMEYVLRVDPIIGVVADVVCAKCGKTGAVRLHWEEVDWDEPDKSTD